MYQWRVTKYNPQMRDAEGRYLAEDWTSVSDVGKEIGGVVVSFSDYRQTEDLYVEAVVDFMIETGIDSLQVVDIEENLEYINLQSREFPYDIVLHCAIPAIDQWVSQESLRCSCRLALREIIWCKLEVDETFFVHFGYDYYMYIGSNRPCNNAIDQVVRSGLFVEPMGSPYK